MSGMPKVTGLHDYDYARLCFEYRNSATEHAHGWWLAIDQKLKRDADIADEAMAALRELVSIKQRIRDCDIDAHMIDFKSLMECKLELEAAWANARRIVEPTK